MKILEDMIALRKEEEEVVVRRTFLGIVGVLVFGIFSGVSGAFAAPVLEMDSEPLEMSIDETALTDDVRRNQPLSRCFV